MITDEPIPGVQMKPPKVAPEPGQVIIGYEVVEPQQGCCKCDGMNSKGQLSTIVWLLVFAPLAWIPCLLRSSFDIQQRPVYGAPGSRPVDDDEVVTKHYNYQDLVTSVKGTPVDDPARGEYKRI